LESIIHTLEGLSKGETLFALLKISLFFAVLYDIVKFLIFKILKYFYEGIKSLPSKANKVTKKNIEILIKSYNRELIELKKINNNDKGTLMNILERVFGRFTIVILIFLVLFFANIKDSLLFYILLAANISMLTEMFIGIFYDFRLINKSKNYNQSKNNIKNKILKLEEIINKIS